MERIMVMCIKKQNLRPLALVFTLALALRVGFILTCGRGEERYDALYDDQIYTGLALQLVSGHGYTMSQDYFVARANEPTSIVEPGYPFLLASSYFLFGEHPLPARLIQSMISAMVPAMIYLVNRKLFGILSALIASLLATIYPLFIMYTRPLLTETMFCLLLLVCLYMFYMILGRQSCLNFLLIGTILGICSLVRSETIFYFAPLFILLSHYIIIQIFDIYWFIYSYLV